MKVNKRNTFLAALLALFLAYNSPVKAQDVGDTTKKPSKFELWAGFRKPHGHSGRKFSDKAYYILAGNYNFIDKDATDLVVDGWVGYNPTEEKLEVDLGLQFQQEIWKRLVLGARGGAYSIKIFGYEEKECYPHLSATARIPITDNFAASLQKSLLKWEDYGASVGYKMKVGKLFDSNTKITWRNSDPFGRNLSFEEIITNGILSLKVKVMKGFDLMEDETRLPWVVYGEFGVKIELK